VTYGECQVVEEGKEGTNTYVDFAGFGQGNLECGDDIRRVFRLVNAITLKSRVKVAEGITAVSHERDVRIQRGIIR
jgi:hypothetical protein